MQQIENNIKKKFFKKIKNLKLYNKFLAGQNINIQKSIIFLYANNKESKNEVREEISLTKGSTE